MGVGGAEEAAVAGGAVTPYIGCHHSDMEHPAMNIARATSSSSHFLMMTCLLSVGESVT